jgi:hypothetical protein
MTKCKAMELSYDLDRMTPVEEQQFWYEFETMLLRARNGSSVQLSKVNIINSATLGVSETEITLH